MGFGEARVRELDRGVVCGVRVTRGLDRGDDLFAGAALWIDGDAGTDLLAPSDFVNGLLAVLSGVTLLRAPIGLGPELAADFRGPCGLFLPNADGCDLTDVAGEPTNCCFGVTFGEFDPSRPVSDFRFPRIGFGPKESAGGGDVRSSVVEGLTMRGPGLPEPLFGVDVVILPGSSNLSRLV